MSREEAISKWIYPAIATMWNANKCNEILEALEQEPILDKIRAEIDDATEIHSDGEFYIKNIDVKRIIDKYTAESAHDVVLDIVKNNGIVDL